MDNKHTRVHEVVSNFFNILTKKNYLLEEDQIKIFKRKMINSGPLYVKICQLIAQRTDLFEINDLLKKELEELHDNVPPHEYSDTIKMLKSYDLENDIFFTNKNPIGVGAMAQVYLQELEAAKWVEHFDEYTDRIYFEHSETGEIAWDEKPKDRGFVLRK